LKKAPPYCSDYKELSFHPFRRVRGVCYNEGFWRDTIKDAALALIRTSRRVFNWIKKNYRKEFFVSFVFLMALLPDPHQVKAATPAAPAYIQPVPRLEPVVAVSFPVPEEVSPVAIPEPPAAPVPPPVVAPISTYSGSGDPSLDWIIQHESGGNPYAMNSIGACGLGQSLPCSKVLGVCGSLDNVACQIEWVRSYCNSRYGSTYNAYLFWQANNWY
jgi:hypothetical protein